DDRRPVLCLAQAPAHLASIQPRHAHIENEEIRLLLARELERFEPVAGDEHPEPAPLQKRREGRGYRFVIVRQDDSRHPASPIGRASRPARPHRTRPYAAERARSRATPGTILLRLRSLCTWTDPKCS